MTENKVLTPNDVNGSERKAIVRKAMQLIINDFKNVDELLIYFFGLSDWYAFILEDEKAKGNSQISATKRLGVQIENKFNLPVGFSAFFVKFVKNIYIAKYENHEPISQDFEKYFF